MLKQLKPSVVNLQNKMSCEDDTAYLPLRHPDQPASHLGGRLWTQNSPTSLQCLVSTEESEREDLKGLLRFLAEL